MNETLSDVCSDCKFWQCEKIKYREHDFAKEREEQGIDWEEFHKRHSGYCYIKPKSTFRSAFVPACKKFEHEVIKQKKR